MRAFNKVPEDPLWGGDKRNLDQIWRHRVTESKEKELTAPSGSNPKN